MQSSPITVLIVDDDDDIRMLVRAVLQGAGLSVVDEADDGPAALESMNHLDPPKIPTVMVLDNRMPTLTGIEVAQRVLAQTPDQRIVLFSAYLNGDVEREAREAGVTRCVSKAEISRLPEIINELASS